MKAKTRVNQGFWAGFGCMAALSCALQDFLGKEKYIEYVQTNWWDFPSWFWIVWLGLAITFIAVKIILGRLPVEE